MVDKTQKCTKTRQVSGQICVVIDLLAPGHVMGQSPEQHVIM
ncbi:hypothetical protein [Sagittula sp. SSi028]